MLFVRFNKESENWVTKKNSKICEVKKKKSQKELNI